MITGNVIPAGTGMREFDDMMGGFKDEFALLMGSREVLGFDEDE